ncbi:hypothetical protein [Sphaerisporangium corydalis]|uniref:SnoaL-like domain-containing protein n=1 Tax=Sphaerisporangium corydalis TaxID=1441875 RepID=A0ABV9ED26_9ACTN|nr:hypothetical protein [Sphaerisporangium corydalis]
MTDTNTRDLVNRYVALWNEPDAKVRRRTIEELWAEGGAHVLQPPEEMRKAAAGLGFASTTLEAHGYDQLEVRVAHSYEEFVAPGEFVFRPGDNAARLHNVVKFTWEMIPVGGDEVVGGGLDVLILDDDDHITTDYMFPGL